MTNPELNPYSSIVLAGGLGTRFKPCTGPDFPKALVPVGGKELIKYTTDELSPDIVRELVFAVGFCSDQIRNWVETQNFPHVVKYSFQEHSGITGALEAAVGQISNDHVITANSDEIRWGAHFHKFVMQHQVNSQHGALGTILCGYSDRLYRRREIIPDNNNRIIKTFLKSEKNCLNPDRFGLINTGMVIFNIRAFEYMNPSHNPDWSGIIDPLVDAGLLYVHIDPDIRYFNVGTPEEMSEAGKFLQIQQEETSTFSVNYA
jgi:NDP-sugar pyrophosphorylase family protein